jgi:hypothetical protein
MSQILIIPVIIDPNQYNQNERPSYPGIATDFYPILIKQLQNIFRRIVTSITTEVGCDHASLITNIQKLHL